jgi:hypothetical protein
MADGLVVGQNFLSGLPLDSFSEDVCKNVGNAAWQWYQNHSVSVHVKTLNELVQLI